MLSMTDRLTSVINVQCILYLMGGKVFYTIIKNLLCKFWNFSCFSFHKSSSCTASFFLKYDTCIWFVLLFFLSQTLHQYNTVHQRPIWCTVSFSFGNCYKKIKFIIKKDINCNTPVFWQAESEMRWESCKRKKKTSQNTFKNILFQVKDRIDSRYFMLQESSTS